MQPSTRAPQSAAISEAPPELLPSPFTRLPGELRNEIYRLAFVRQDVITPNILRPTRSGSGARDVRKTAIDHLLICKSIFYEASQVLLHSTRFIFFSRNDLDTFLALLQPYLRLHVARVALHIPEPALHRPSWDIDALGSQLPSLIVLYLHVQGVGTYRFLLDDDEPDESVVGHFEGLPQLCRLRGLDDFRLILEVDDGAVARRSGPAYAAKLRTVFTWIEGYVATMVKQPKQPGRF